MKEKIQEVQDYFKSKLLAGDFDIKEVSQYYVDVVINREYPFCLWTGNMDLPHTVRTYQNGQNFIHLTFTKEESIQLHSIVKVPVITFKKNTLINQKREELESLLKETEDEV